MAEKAYMAENAGRESEGKSERKNEIKPGRNIGTANIGLPELLSPAGTPEAFCAALDGGADAVYFGVSGFNARANARNFTFEEMRRAAYMAHTVGAKVYITLNTMLYDREYSLMLKTAEEIYRGGADAVIVADLGAAALLHKYIPELELHASTQCAGHNLAAARELARLGFTRMVPARELSLENIRYLTENSPIETEIFIHGALCVSHSGQCLFSSLVGGRSGNRGECAQPCRMKYKLICEESAGFAATGGRGRHFGGEERVIDDGYPLSLKDLSLCRHVTEIISSGADSLKIEGRMKSPAYVREVTAIWRTLLDGRRNATDDEERRLADIFSRGGSFTDGYFISGVKSVNNIISASDMAGVRTDDDKDRARVAGATQSGSMGQRSGQSPTSQKQAQKRIEAGDDNNSTGEFEFRTERKRKINVTVSLCEGQAAKLELSLADFPALSASVFGDTVTRAERAPLDTERVEKSIKKFGSTCFEVRSCEVDLEGERGVFMTAGALNALRRQGAEALERLINAPFGAREGFRLPEGGDPVAEYLKDAAVKCGESPARAERSAYFSSVADVTERAAEYFDYRFVPLAALAMEAEEAEEAGGSENIGQKYKYINGVALPPVIFDSEAGEVKRLLEAAAGLGIRYVLIENIGQLELMEKVEKAERYGFEIFADLRFNVASAATLAALSAGHKIKRVILSPEVTLAQARDIVSVCGADRVGLTVYGRLPLMILERCIMRGKNAICPEGYDCGHSLCTGKNFSLCDRTGAHFPVMREWKHRNVIYNSCPVIMSDRADEIRRAGILNTHYIFTVEGPAKSERVMDSYIKQLPPPEGERVRRIK